LSEYQDPPAKPIPPLTPSNY